MTVAQATLAAITESAQAAARLAAAGERKASESALARAEKRLAQFSEGKPWHKREVRVAREVVAQAKLVVDGASPRVANRRTRKLGRAIERMKA